MQHVYHSLLPFVIFLSFFLLPFFFFPTPPSLFLSLSPFPSFCPLSLSFFFPLPLSPLSLSLAEPNCYNNESSTQNQSRCRASQIPCDPAVDAVNMKNKTPMREQTETSPTLDLLSM